MWRSISLLLALACLAACSEKRKESFTHARPGYYYRLLSFSTDSCAYRPLGIAHLSATFKTQSDSVFWDSHNNLNDRFFMWIDSSAQNMILHYVSRACISDSACLLIRPADFFAQQFGSDSLPYFCQGDTVVKVELKLKDIVSREAFKQLETDYRRQEQEQIEAFFGSAAQLEQSIDPMGVYWISRPAPAPALPAIEEGDLVLLSYKGSFLNGRLFETSGAHFEYIYGTPDQLLKGLNYATGKLKLGQTAKILLSSRLAFGEYGSSNGTIPPFTPLIYELKIIDVKK